MKKSILLLLLVSIFGISCSEPKEDTLLLKLNLDKDFASNSSITMDMDMKMNMMQQNMDMTMKMSAQQDMKVMDIDTDTNYTFSYNIAFNDFTLDMMGQKMNLEEMKANDSTGVISKLFSAENDLDIEITITPFGKVKNIKGFENFYSMLNDEKSAQQIMQVQQIYQSMINERMFDNSLAYLNGEEIKIGDSIKVNFDVMKDFGVKSNIIYILDKFDDKNAYFNATMTYEMEMMREGLKVKMDSSDFKIKLIVDRKTGWVTEQTMWGKFVINMISPDGVEVGKMDITMNTIQKEQNN